MQVEYEHLKHHVPPTPIATIAASEPLLLTNMLTFLASTVRWLHLQTRRMVGRLWGIRSLWRWSNLFAKTFGKPLAENISIISEPTSLRVYMFYTTTPSGLLSGWARERKNTPRLSWSTHPLVPASIYFACSHSCSSNVDYLEIVIRGLLKCM